MNIKMLLLGAVLAACASQVSAQESSLKITITNLNDRSGMVFIGWYANATTFSQKSKAVFYKSVKVSKQQQCAVTFDHIPEGSYAIAAFLDENGNEKLDKNFLGIPKEKYGFSNNVVPAMRPPKFDEAMFKLTAGTENITIKLK